MMIYNTILVCVLLFFLLKPVDAASAVATLYTPKKLAEIKALPTDGAETAEMVTAGSVLRIISSVTDTLDRIWYLVRIAATEKGGFVLGGDIEPLPDEIDTLNTPRIGKPLNEEKKRRLAIVKANPDWSRRVKSALLAGTICLGMSREQLAASWLAPDHETSGFVIGAGEVSILFYRKVDPVAVVVKNGEVIGWSEKKQN